MHDLAPEQKYHAIFTLLKCLKGKIFLYAKKEWFCKQKVTDILKEGSMWKENKNFWCLKLSRYRITNILLVIFLKQFYILHLIKCSYSFHMIFHSM